MPEPVVQTEKLIRSIEYVLPKLKYSCYIGNVLKWLENFDAIDIEAVLDFLFYFEYITFSELQLRLVEQLKKALKKIPKTHKVVIVPFGKYGKSSDIMVYLIRKTPYFAKKKSIVSIERDIDKIDTNLTTSIIFLDDFIGSGNSFIKDYKKRFEKFIVNHQNVSDDCYIIAAVAMIDGKKKIEKTLINVKVCAQFRRNAFDELHSVFRAGYGHALMSKLATKYGSNIVVGYDLAKNEPLYTPLGYDGVASLMAFDYGCPNNTLSIIWGSDKWHPIFPRFAKDRMKQAAEFKKTVAFYIGIMNRLGIDLYEDETIIVDGKREIKYNTREDHSLITVLTLKRRQYDNILICQILGITEDELRAIELFGKQKGLLDYKFDFTSTGNHYLDFLISKANDYKINAAL